MSRAIHLLATAHFASAAVALFVACLLAVRSVDVALSPGVEALSAPATVCRAAAILYLLATATIEIGLGRRYRRASWSTRAEWLLLAGQGMLIVAAGAVLMRGHTARLYLAGLDHVLAAILTVALVSIALTVVAPLLRRAARPGEQLDAPSSSSLGARLAPWVFAAAGMTLVASLGYLESRPLPGEVEAPPTEVAAGHHPASSAR